MKFHCSIVFLLLFAQQVYAQPPDRKIRVDTIFAGDTICLPDSVTKFTVEIIHANGRIVTMRGNGSCITASAGAKSGSRILVKEIIVSDRAGNKTRMDKRNYYVR